MANLPYVTAPGNIDKALKAIKAAATPDSVNQDFVKTILKIPGGSGNQMTAYLKKIGFANQDGTPSDIYRRFRNTATSGDAAAAALRIGYKPLYVRNEYMHALGDDKLRGLIIEETGQGDDSSVVQLVLAAIKAIKKFATWGSTSESDETTSKMEVSQVVATIPAAPTPPPSLSPAKLGMNLSYTINLNLPPTSDIAVFNAIFKSLKEHLLRTSDD